MDILKYEEIDLAETIKRSEQDVNNVLDTVSDILNNVKDKGDEALKSYTEKFDGVLVDDLKVNEDEIKEAYDKNPQLENLLLDDYFADAITFRTIRTTFKDGTPSLYSTSPIPSLRVIMVPDIRLNVLPSPNAIYDFSSISIACAFLLKIESYPSRQP